MVIEGKRPKSRPTYRWMFGTSSMEESVWNGEGWNGATMDRRQKGSRLGKILEAGTDDD